MPSAKRIGTCAFPNSHAYSACQETTERDTSAERLLFSFSGASKFFKENNGLERWGGVTYLNGGLFYLGGILLTGGGGIAQPRRVSSKQFG